MYSSRAEELASLAKFGYDFQRQEMEDNEALGAFDAFITAADIEAATPTASAPEPFCIDSEDRAEWLLRRLSAIRAEKERITANAAKRTQELDADYAGLIGRFGADLEQWSRAEAERRRRKTITLLSGTLSFRAVPASLRVASITDALTTAKAVLPEAVTVETTENLDKKAYLAHAKQLLETTGELLPGIERTEARESFSIN